MIVTEGYEPLVELTRGGTVECRHFGAMAVVDSSGRLLAAAGDPELVTFPRSSMKPFQALPFVEAGGVEHFGVDQESLAVLCASHAGTDAHARVIGSLLRKFDLHESDLQCGVHWPMDSETAEAMRLRGEEPTPIRHNCSGKHTGMLGMARLLGAPKESYLDPAHPVQQGIIQVLAEMTGLPAETLLPGTDGCSAPVYALPLRAFAWGVARLCDPFALAAQRQAACRKITAAMMAHPVMVAGPGRLDTVLMSALSGRGIVKGGAEGYQMIGLMPGALGSGSAGIGIAFKFSDGDPSRRATHCLITALLNALNLADVAASAEFAPFAESTLRNWRGLPIGEIRLSRPLKVTLPGVA